jgi:hypothetical protein
MVVLLTLDSQEPEPKAMNAGAPPFSPTAFLLNATLFELEVMDPSVHAELVAPPA